MTGLIFISYAVMKNLIRAKLQHIAVQYKWEII